MNDHLVVLVTAASDTEARRLARRLLEKRLAACVNFAPVTSMFRWQDAIQEEEEILLIIKTHTEAFDELAATVKSHHSYDTPEVIGLPIVLGSRAYLEWIDHEVKA